jgi:hypothetical protein
MHINITDNLRIKEVKEVFKKAFPGLKIEFVKNAHADGVGSSKTEIIPHNPCLWEIRKFHIELPLDVKKSQTVAEVEGFFRDKLGLHVQIFRKSGNVWIETVNTDSRTLEEQMTLSKARIEG